MDHLPEKLARRGGVLLVVALAACTGCVSTDKLLCTSSHKPTGIPCQIVTTWNNSVLFTPDPTHGGTPIPGLAGRLYLFGPEMDLPLICDGTLTVDLYDTKTDPADPKALPLEQWRLDKDTLKRLQKRDTIGWGYTLFLPWGTYRPDITQVRLKVRFDTPNGMPLYGPQAPLTLERPETRQTQTNASAKTGNGSESQTQVILPTSNQTSVQAPKLTVPLRPRGK